ncbi:hypothetical protein EJB05_26607, partial [Eragrostis curvula]
MASSSSPPPTPFPTTPNPGPDPDGPLLLPLNHLAAAPQPLMFMPGLCDAIHRELVASPDDDPACAQILTRAQTHLQALTAQLRLATAAATSAASADAARSRSRSCQIFPNIFKFSESLVISSAPLPCTRPPCAPHLQSAPIRRIYAGRLNRANLHAFSMMLSAGHCLHRKHHIIGHIPGVLVGDAFLYRAELCVVGLHTALQAGISYISGSVVSEGHHISTSIVSSGGYLDDEDTGDVLVYTGSGGRLDHHADQLLEGGNLALHNSHLYGIEVRVIRGHTCDAVRNRNVYVYDGLYTVVSSDFCIGKSGHEVCKFKLLRLPGQDDLGSESWNTAKLLKHAIDSKILPPWYISLDLSNGKEPVSIPICNLVDDDRSPLDFEYIVSTDFSVLGLVKQEGGCHCTCGRLWIEVRVCEKQRWGSRSVQSGWHTCDGRPVVYECGALCGCPITCVNRVTQRGVKHRLEVFRFTEKEWGVRTLDLIHPGAFVCEYSGEVVVMDALRKDRCIIDPYKRFPPRWSEWGDASSRLQLFPGAEYLLDMSRKRSVAYYISHSGTPNVFLQYVLRGNGVNRAVFSCCSPWRPSHPCESSTSIMECHE